MKISTNILITQIIEHKTGIGKNGNEWHRMTVIVGTNDQVYFPAQCWGEVQPGEYYATIEIKGREWNGKHYPEILLSDLVAFGQVVEPEPIKWKPEPSLPPYDGANQPGDPSLFPQPQPVNDLPF